MQRPMPLQSSQLQLPEVWTPVDQEIIEGLLLELDDDPEEMTPTSVTDSHRQPLVYSDASSSAINPTVEVNSAPTILMPEMFQLLKAPCTHLDQDALRKAKHREVQRRFMERKKEKIGKTKQLVAQLAKQYDILQLAAEEKELKIENQTIEVELADKVPFVCPPHEYIDLLLEDQLKLIREHFEPLPHEFWAELIQRNIDDTEILTREPNYQSTGAKVMGWTDKRKIEGSMIKFVITKEFHHLSAWDFMNTTWDKLCLPETHPKLFNSVLMLKMQVLQQVNEDQMVVHRVVYNRLSGGMNHTIDTMVRVQHGRDHIIFMRSLNKNRALECVASSHEWVDVMTSLIYSPKPANDRKSGCIMRYAGWLNNFSPMEIQYWLLEMLWIILRFESVMVSPIFALHQEEDDT